MNVVHGTNRVGMDLVAMQGGFFMSKNRRFEEVDTTQEVILHTALYSSLALFSLAILVTTLVFTAKIEEGKVLGSLAPYKTYMLLVEILVFCTLVAGMAAQSVLGNAVAGVFMSIMRPIRLGDNVTIVANTGTVSTITPMHTVLSTEEKEIMIPSTTIVNSVFIRHRKPDDQAKV